MELKINILTIVISDKHRNLLADYSYLICEKAAAIYNAKRFGKAVNTIDFADIIADFTDMIKTDKQSHVILIMTDMTAFDQSVTHTGKTLIEAAFQAVREWFGEEAIRRCCVVAADFSDGEEDFSQLTGLLEQEQLMYDVLSVSKTGEVIFHPSALIPAFAACCAVEWIMENKGLMGIYRESKNRNTGRYYDSLFVTIGALAADDPMIRPKKPFRNLDILPEHQARLLDPFGYAETVVTSSVTGPLIYEGCNYGIPEAVYLMVDSGCADQEPYVALAKMNDQAKMWEIIVKRSVWFNDAEISADFAHVYLAFMLFFNNDDETLARYCLYKGEVCKLNIILAAELEYYICLNNIHEEKELELFLMIKPYLNDDMIADRLADELSRVNGKVFRPDRAALYLLTEENITPQRLSMCIRLARILRAGTLDGTVFPKNTELSARLYEQVLRTDSGNSVMGEALDVLREYVGENGQISPDKFPAILNSPIITDEIYMELTGSERK